MTNAKRRKLWRARVADYRASDLTVRAWCERNGVTDKQLRYWLARIGEDSPVSEGSEPKSGVEGSAWARVEIVEDASAVELGNGRSVCSVGPQLSVRVGSSSESTSEVSRGALDAR